MNLVEINISELKPDPRNARKHSKANIEAIKKSLLANPQYRPFVVQRGTNVVCVGNGMLQAMKELGIEKAFVEYRDLDDEQFIQLSLADNKTAEMAEWDDDILESLRADCNLEIPGFDGIEAPDMEQEEAPEIIEDEAPDDVDDFVNLGDIWLLGNHRLMCGDSTVVTDVEKLMNGEKADMVLSDPPYGMHLNTDFSSIKSKKNTQGNKYSPVIGDNNDFSPNLIKTFFENFPNVSEMFLFGADYFAELLPNRKDGSWLVWDKRKESQADGVGSEFELIWSKSKHKRRVLRFDWFGFLSSKDAEDARNRVHPTQKPVSLCASIIQQWGEKAHTIVDLFGGSGSTLIACEQLKRKCYMMELDTHYVSVIIRRWEQLTGKKATKWESDLNQKH